jgi:Uma2 family endonuclease
MILEKAVYQHIAKLHRLTGEQFDKMRAQNIFASNAKVELLEGVMIDMSVSSSQHQGLVIWLTERLGQVLVAQPALLMVGGVLALSEYSRPMPDILLLNFRKDYYRNQLPTASDVLLLIEVADSDLLLNKEVKVPMYARHNIVQTWVIDPAGRKIVNAYQPTVAGYEKIEESSGGIIPVRALGIPFDISDIFG